MITLDTSVWIEFFKGNEPIGQSVSTLLEDRKVFAVECVFGELLQGHKGKREREIILDFWNNLPQIRIESLWVEAGLYAAKNRTYSKGVGLIDVCILLASRKESSKIWTLDKKLRSLCLKEELYL